jgi:IS5 family transposase
MQQYSVKREVVMAIKTNPESWADYEISCRKQRKLTFLDQILILIDWSKIERIIRKKYKKFFNAVGNPAYPSLVMFKILLLQTWYDLSDPMTEDYLLNWIPASRFVGLSLASDVPDHSTICRFRNELKELDVYGKLFNEINRQLEEKKILVKKGAIVDATVIESSRRPRKVVKTESIPLDRQENEKPDTSVPEITYSDDTDAKWLVKGKKAVYGYKVHMSVDDRNGFILGGHVTGANVSDMNEIKQVVEESGVKEKSSVAADKGYASQNNRDMLKDKKMKSRIMRKAARGRELTEREKLFNRLISKFRYLVEQTNGILKQHYGFSRMRYLGCEKGEMEFYLKAMALNLKKAARLCFQV